jgi:hemoglobin/transferrin/lactoferrin receptor protein
MHMKKNIFLWLFALVIGMTLQAQKVAVIDYTTRQTIPGAVIYNKATGASVVTDAKGQADVSSLSGSDSLRIRQFGYAEKVIAYSSTLGGIAIVELVSSDLSMDEVVISANRWETDQMETPYRIEKINLREAQFQNPQTSADLLGSGGNVYIQKSQLGGGSPIIRGFATNRVMIVVDGVRMNNAIFRTGNLQNVISLDAGGFESAEVLFGPGAVMYGSDAIGGVMDFHTLQPKFSAGEKPTFTGSAFGRFSSANMEKSGHLDFNIGLQRWAFTTSFTYSMYDDLRSGSNGESFYLRPFYQQSFSGSDSMVANSDPSLQIHSGYNQKNVLQKIRFRMNDSLELDYGFHYSATSDVPRYDRLWLDANNDSVFDNAEWYYGPQTWMMNRIGITHSKSNVLYDHFRTVIAHQSYEESRHDRKFGSKKLRHQTEKVGIISANVDLDKKCGEKTTFYYGAEFVYNSISSSAFREHIETGEPDPPINTRYPDGSTWMAVGAYVSAKYKAAEKILVNTGVRYSHFIIDAKFDTTLFPYPYTGAGLSKGALNGSLGFIFSPIKNWSIYVNGSTGFRAPNIDDIGKVFESGNGTVVVPNPDLDPEYAYSGEAGTSVVAGNFMKLDVSGYYTQLNNAFARRNFQVDGQDSILYDGQMSQVQAIQNITKAYVYGVQAELNFYFGHGIGMRNTFNWMKGEEQSEDSLIYYPLSHVTPLYGSSHLTYERKKVKLDFYVQYNGKMDYADFSLSERTDNGAYVKDASGLPYTPSWYTLNFKAGVYINKNVGVNAGVENITDQLYRPYGSGISAPGRNFIVAVHARF